MRDVQKYKSVSKAPLLINSCEIDMMFPADAQAATDKVLGNGAFPSGYERTYWEGCTHGFSVRGDLVRPPVVWLLSEVLSDAASSIEQPEGQGRKGGRLQGQCRVPDQAPVTTSIRGVVGAGTGRYVLWIVFTYPRTLWKYHSLY